MRRTISVLLLAVSCVVAQTHAFAQSGPDDNGGPGRGPNADERGGPSGPGGPNGQGGPGGDHGGPQHAGGPVRAEAARGPVPHRDWHRGDRLPPDYRGPKYVVADWHAYDLQPPPSGYQWVQVNGDFVLAAIATGVITSILLAPHR